MITNALIRETVLELDRGFTISVIISVNGENHVIAIRDLKSTSSNDIYGLLANVGVKTWEGLTNAACRIKLEEGQTTAIGSFLDDTWYELVDPVKPTLEEFEEVDEK